MDFKKSISRRTFQKLAIAGSATVVATPMRTGQFAAAQEAGDPQYGGALRVALPADVVGFDIRVRAQTDNPSRSVWEQILQPLARLETDLTHQPALATEWTATEDAHEYTFTLREGVKFHNGDDFSADDVIFTFESMLDPDFQSATAGQYRNVTSIEKVDDYSVKFVLESPDAEFVDKIARMGILPSTHVNNVGSDEFNANPVGTGPFKFTEWIPETRIVLDRNDEYWDPQLPYLDQVVFMPIVEDSVRIASLEAGELDLWQRNVPPEDVERLQEDSRFVLEFNPFIYYHYISLSLENVPAFAQKAVRQAAAYAIDRELITAVIGYGTPGTGPVNPVSPYFNPDLTYYSYDPDKALQILEEAGVNPSDVSFTLQTFTYPDYQKVGELSYENLKALGFNVELRVDDWSVVSAKCNLPEASCDAYNTATGGLGPDAALFDSFHTNGSANAHFYSNERVDELLVLGRSTVDEGKRREIYDEALEIILDESPRIFINDQTIPVIHWSYVQGFDSNPIYSYAQLDRTWIDQQAKDELT